MKRTIQALIMALLVASCAAYHSHPGAYNKWDSITYDVLKSDKLTISNSRTQINKGELPADFTPVIDAMDKAYQPAAAAYKAWHKAALAGNSTPDQLKKLQSLLDALNAAMATFRSSK